MKSYLESILDYYYGLSFDMLDAKTVHQVQRSFLDYYGCAAYTAKHQCCKPLIDVLLDLGAPGESTVFGSRKGSNMASAACVNACRVSNIEMDDGSGINAAVHPGLYVWSAALAAFEEQPCDKNTLVIAIIFGYDVCMRLGMLAAKNVEKMELHGPGISGAFGAVAAAGMILGLNRDQMENALGMAGALLPICPFISFVKGTDNKDLYGGWGVYLAMVAIAAAKRGLTGPTEIMDGAKSLRCIYSGDWGTDAPFGAPYYINVIGFKEFPACLSTHPSLIALEAIRNKHNFSSDEVERITVTVHPGAYTLNNGATQPLTPTSARLYLPYCIAACLQWGELRPEHFEETQISSGALDALAARVQVEVEPMFSQEHGGPACRMTLLLTDGAVLTEETRGIRWCVSKPSDEDLIGKFRMLTKDIFTADICDEIIANIMEFNMQYMQRYIDILGRL